MFDQDTEKVEYRFNIQYYCEDEMRGIKDEIMLDEGCFNYVNFKQGIWVKTALWHTASVIFRACCHLVNGKGTSENPINVHQYNHRFY